MGREQVRPVPGFFAGEIMKIMTQNAEYLSECTYTTQLAQELVHQDITLLALRGGDLNSAQQLVHSLEAQGKPCSWIWFPDGADNNGEETGTAFLCLDRVIRSVDRFSLNNRSNAERHTSNTALGIQLEGMDDWFYCISQYPEEEHPECWKLLNGCIAGKWLCSTVWLLGIQPQGSSTPSGSWFAAAEGRILCSRRREIRSCTEEYIKSLCPHTKGAAIIEVEE